MSGTDHDKLVARIIQGNPLLTPKNALDTIAAIEEALAGRIFLPEVGVVGCGTAWTDYFKKSPFSTRKEVFSAGWKAALAAIPKLTPPRRFRQMTSGKIVIEIDEDGYPDEASLQAIRTANLGREGGRWLAEELTKAYALIPYGKCAITDIDNDFYGPCKEIRLVTGGWSGCEELIGAILNNPALRSLYYAKWERGGAFTFVVPTKELTAHDRPTIASRSQPTEKQDA
jgi:hypothetical protein